MKANRLEKLFKERGHFYLQEFAMVTPFKKEASIQSTKYTEKCSYNSNKHESIFYIAYGAREPISDVIPH
jgi:hypothetical protein